MSVFCMAERFGVLIAKDNANDTIENRLLLNLFFFMITVLILVVKVKIR